MLGRLLGTNQLPAKYDPLAALERVNPLLERELRLIPRYQPHQLLTPYDNQFLRIAMLIHGLSLCICCWAAISERYLIPAFFLVLPSVVISIGADIYASVRTIFRWHTASQRETWDTLRLAMRDDGELLSTYEAISNIRTWSAFRFDMTMRSVPTGITAIVGVALMVGAVLSLRNTPPLVLIELIVLGALFIRAAVLYISDPFWRFRANIVWSLLCAIKFRDTTTAISAAIAGSLCVRLLHLGVIVGAFLPINGWLGRESVFIMRSDIVQLTLGFAELAILVLPITRWCYVRLYQWLERQALFALRSGDV